MSRRLLVVHRGRHSGRGDAASKEGLCVCVTFLDFYFILKFNKVTSESHSAVHIPTCHMTIVFISRIKVEKSQYFHIVTKKTSRQIIDDDFVKEVFIAKIIKPNKIKIKTKTSQGNTSEPHRGRITP